MAERPPVARVSNDLHVIPAFGNEHHLAPDCWCHPRVDDGALGDGGRVWVHNVVEPERCAVKVRATTCPIGRVQHAASLLLGDDTELAADDAIALIDAGRQLYMVPPEGAPARQAYVDTGLPLVVQVVRCPDCGVRVLFA